jgi:hypothetical protein
MRGHKLYFLLLAVVCGCNTLDDNPVPRNLASGGSVNRKVPLSSAREMAGVEGNSRSLGDKARMAKLPPIKDSMQPQSAEEGEDEDVAPLVSVPAPTAPARRPPAAFPSGVARGPVPGTLHPGSGIRAPGAQAAGAQAPNGPGPRGVAELPPPAIDPELARATYYETPKRALTSEASAPAVRVLPQDGSQGTRVEKFAGTELPPLPIQGSESGAAGGAPPKCLVNSKRFTLGYAIKDPSGVGIGDVEVWGTMDCRDWKHVPAVPQGTNGLLVEVANDGLYGFVMAARIGDANGPRPPRPGEQPQVWIHVDTTRPTVELEGVDLSLTSRLKGLVVRWKAQDRNFGPRPINITFAETPEGPWATLATGIENTGRFECPIPRALPRRVLIRVEATDMMGNVGHAETPNPVRVEIPLPVATEEGDSTPTRSQPSERPRPTVSIVTVESKVDGK